jgi:hypothetical protein
MRALRVEGRWTLPERGGAGSEPRLALAVLAIGAVFVCFFALGRLTATGGSAAHSEAPPTAAGASASVAIPSSLASVPPLAGVSVPRAAPAPSHPSSPAPATEAKQPLVSPVFATPAQSTPAPASSPAAPAGSPAPAPTPSPAATTPAPTGGHFGSGGQSPGRGSPAPPASGGGFFDTSG